VSSTPHKQWSFNPSVQTHYPSMDSSDRQQSGLNSSCPDTSGYINQHGLLTRQIIYMRATRVICVCYGQRQGYFLVCVCVCVCVHTPVHVRGILHGSSRPGWPEVVRPEDIGGGECLPSAMSDSEHWASPCITARPSRSRSA
jgi:hypothetical protein